MAAHSGGGLLMPAVANRLRAQHLVCIGAVIPDFAGGGSALDQIKTSQDTMFGPRMAGVQR